MPLERESPTPLYLQLKNSLFSEIQSGRLQPHQRLLSERELCERFKVSRMTVRQALAELMRDGLVYARAGKGTFVSEPKIKQELRSLTGFSQDMTRRGSVPSSRVLEARLIPASLQISKVLFVSPGSEIVLLKRLRMSDGTPLAVETAHLPHPFCPGILEHDFTRESLYRILETRYGIQLASAEQTIEAGLATAEELELLQVTPPSAVLRIERLTRTQQETPVEYVLSTYRVDRYKFHTTLQPIQWSKPVSNVS